MKTAPRHVVAVIAGSLALAACNVAVDKGDDRKNVDIRTPLGNLSVHNGAEPPDTGLPVYQGARPVREHDSDQNADVSIGTSLFGVKVRAAKFESDDAPDRILDFYKDAMKSYGTVTECHGDVDFKGPSGARTPVCRDRGGRDGIELVVGSEARHRIVAVKPRARGSEFSLVYLETRGSN
jgi:hypothetical protein